MSTARPPAVPPWWQRRDPIDTRRSRARLVVRVLVMFGLLAAVLTI